MIRQLVVRSQTRFPGRLAWSCLAGIGLVAIGLGGWVPQAQAQTLAPYLLPYTVQIVAGGGTAPTVGATCLGTNGVVGTAFNTQGDGCPVTSGNVTVGVAPDLHDVVVDPQGNIFFIDSTGSVGVVRRIDARSGIITLYAGNLSGGQPKVACPTVIDKYGDFCQANDGKGNVTPVLVPPATTAAPYLYTANLGKFRGLGIAPNGDLYLANYSNNLIHRISRATGVFSLVAGSLTGTPSTPSTEIGLAGYTGDGGPATAVPTGTPSSAALLHAPRGVAIDAAGNLYIADSTNNVIRKVTAASGIITTIAGSTASTAGVTGDGGPATAALLSTPEDVELSPAGDIFIADQANAKVRVIYEGGAAAASLINAVNGTSGTPVVGSIYTVMGGPIPSPSGSTPLPYTRGSIVKANSLTAGARKIALDLRGNLYVADSTNDVIWFVDATSGFMRSVAGTYAVSTSTSAPCVGAADNFGDNCPGNNAILNPNSEMGTAVDAFGNVLISDTGNKLIRRVTTNQVFAPTATGKTLSQTLLIHYAPGDTAGLAPYLITGSGDFTLAVQPCNPTNVDGTTDCPILVTFAPTLPGIDTAGLKITSAKGQVSNFGLSGTGMGAAVAFDPGNATLLVSGLNGAQGVAQDGAGNTYIADTGNNRILQINAAGQVKTFAGTGTAGFTGDGAAATLAMLKAPRAVTVTRTGAVYLADTGNNVIRRVDPLTGFISTVAGNGTVCTTAIDPTGDGCLATQATLAQPSGLAADADGNVFLSDTGNNAVRELTTGGYLESIATGLNGPTGLAVDTNRNLYVADTGNNYIKQIGANGGVTPVAGNGTVASSSSNTTGPANSAAVSAPTGVAVDPAGNLYIADTGGAAVRVVSQGQIANIVGAIGASGTGTLPGSEYNVQLSAPSGVAVSSTGNLIVLDSGNNRAIAINRDLVNVDFGLTNLNVPSPTAQITESATGNSTATLGNSTQFTTSGTTASFTLLPSGMNGCNTTTALSPQAGCNLVAQFTPTVPGTVSATYMESQAAVVNNPVPAINLTGTGAVLSPTTSTTVVTSPPTGAPQYAIPFTVTTTITAPTCNSSAPSCMPSGTVTFSADGKQVLLPVPLSSTGTAAQVISGLSVGTHTISAVYSGDSFYASSTSTLTIVLAKGITTTTVSVPASTLQFASLTLTAKVTTAVAGVYPTGTISFFIAGKLLPLPCFVGQSAASSVAISSSNGVATDTDPVSAATPPAQCPTVANPQMASPGSFGLTAGTYPLTAVFTSGDANYANSTSVVANLVIAPDPVGISSSLSVGTTGTAQGSTAQASFTITPSNTFSGTVTFSCTGMPANSDCTFSPVSLNFGTAPGVATPQSTLVTFFTDVPSGVLAPATSKAITPGLGGRASAHTEWAALLGWPVLLAGMLGLAGFRRRLAASRFLLVLTLFGLFAGSSLVLSGCGSSNGSSAPTPTGTYKVTVTATGANGAVASTPITFTVAAGLPGQL